MNNWESKKLSEIIEIIGGGTPKTSIASYWGGNIPWLSVADFINGGYSELNCPLSTNLKIIKIICHSGTN